METHVKILAWILIISGIFGLIGAACLVAGLIVPGVISQDQTAIAVLTTTAVVLGIFIALTSLPGIIAGIGLLSYQNWARILAVILGFLNLLAFPIGTLIGIYAIWVALDNDTVRLFAHDG